MRRLFKAVMPLLGTAGLVKYIVLGLVSGFCSFLFIHFVTRAVTLIIAGNFEGSRKEYAMIFALAILGFVLVRRTLSLAIIRLSQTLFWNLRKQILSAVLNTNYQQLSGKRMNIHAAVVSDVNVLTNTSLSIISFFTSSILAAATLAYLASISFILFLLTFAVALCGGIIYHYNSKKNQLRFQEARKLERSFLQNMNAILDGFREIFMEPRKGRSLYNEKIRLISRSAYKNNLAAFTGFLNNQITGQVLFYALVSSILVLFSFVFNISAQDTVSFAFTLLYLLGALETIMVALPGLARAKIASNHLMDLKNDLDASSTGNRMPQRYIQKNEFHRITVSNLEFHYDGTEENFGIGPMDFEVKKGEVVFIYGGNGSGKTTFVQSLMGLRFPSSGDIKLNDEPVTAENYPEYRTLFAVVFSDFYLFQELFGIKEPDPEKWNYYLRLFELDGKVSLEGSSFSTTELSMGQRKRLALIAVLLENKPVLVLDEWAADQDPYFRKKFYTVIIPLLKQEDITIIAITHDDKYYHCADRLYRMDYGKLVEECTDDYAINVH